MGVPQSDSVQAQGELPFPITLGRIDVRVEGTSGATVTSVRTRGCRYNKPMAIWIGRIDFPASFLVPYSSLNVSIHMLERGACEEDISPMAGEKEQSIVHENERSIINPSWGAAVTAQSRKVKPDRWAFR